MTRLRYERSDGDGGDVYIYDMFRLFLPAVNVIGLEVLWEDELSTRLIFPIS